MNLLFRIPSDSKLASIAQASLNNEIHCSSLPYGALGCTPHILTYHTILCLSFGRKPLWPFFRIHFSQLDLLLGTIGLGLTTAVHVAILMRRRVGGGSGEVVGGEVGRPISSLDAKDENKMVVGVTPAQNVPSRGPGRQQEPIHLLPLKSASWWILYIPGMLAGIIGLMSLIHKFGHGHRGIPKLTAGFYGIVGVGIITYLLGTIYTLFHLGSLGIVYTTWANL